MAENPPTITQSTELRQLRLALDRVIELIEGDETILDLLMGNITNDPNDVNSGQKFTEKHRTQLMNAVNSSAGRRSAAAIFIDEWITMADRSSKKLPTVHNLLDVLVRCQLFRLADYVASIAGNSRPIRPNSGPAKRVDISIPGESVELMLDGMQYPFDDSVNSVNRDRSKPSPNSPRINFSRSTNQTNENNLSIPNDTPTSPTAAQISHPFQVAGPSSAIEVKSNLIQFSKTSTVDANIPDFAAIRLSEDPIIPATLESSSIVASDVMLPAVLNSIDSAEGSNFVPNFKLLNGSKDSEVEIIPESSSYVSRMSSESDSS